MLTTCLSIAFLVIPVFSQLTISETTFKALNKKFRNQYNQRKNQQIMTNLTTTNMTVDIETDKEARSTFVLGNSYLGYRLLNQDYSNLTKELTCYGCSDGKCPSPAACVGTFTTGDQLLIILEAIQANSEQRYQKMTVRQLAPFTATVRTLTGKTFTINGMSPLDTVGALKYRVLMKEAIPVEEQILVYGGATLTDKMTLGERYIDGKAIVNLIQRK